jgi:hypothetical protein
MKLIKKHHNSFITNILISINMKRKIFSLFAVIVFAVLAFTGCQKDNLVEEQKANGELIIVDAEQTFSITKGFTITKPGTVYVMQTDGSLKMHRTLKIRNLNWSVAQEWFLDDLQTDGYPGYSFYPGDVDGSVHGYYYLWGNQIESGADNNDWSQIIFSDANYTSISGNQFRLPRVDINCGSDFQNLATVLGSTSLIRAKLEVIYDGVDNWGPAFDTQLAGFWMEVRGGCQEANLHPHCGALAMWDKQNGHNDRFAYWYTNIETSKANVRLMRNITSAQW